MVLKEYGEDLQNMMLKATTIRFFPIVEFWREENCLPQTAKEIMDFANQLETNEEYATRHGVTVRKRERVVTERGRFFPLNTFWCRVGPGSQVTRGICRRDLPRVIEDDSPATASLTIRRHHVSRPRFKLSHGVNPVLNRGARRELIFLDDEDRPRFVATLGDAKVSFNALVAAMKES